MKGMRTQNERNVLLRLIEKRENLIQTQMVYNTREMIKNIEKFRLAIKKNCDENSMALYTIMINN